MMSNARRHRTSRLRKKWTARSSGKAHFLRAGVCGFVVLGAAMTAGCGGSGDGTDEETGIFLAFETSFRGYHAWEAFEADGAAIANSPHLDGKRTAYLNQRPPAGSTSFPVGTIIVKEIINDDPAKNDIVARVKRGGTYNARGATGWEWFELRKTTEDSSAIVWRGVAPKVGDSYLGDVAGGCNACHAGADDNSILLPALRLSNF